MFDSHRSELICLHWKDIFHSIKSSAGLQAGITVFCRERGFFATAEFSSTDLGLSVWSSSSAQSVPNIGNKVAAEIRNNLCQEMLLLWEKELLEMLHIYVPHKF